MKKIFFKCYVGLWVTLVSGLSFAGAVEKFFHYQLLNQQPKYFLSTTQEKQFEQLVDHQNPDSETFEQRYFVDETFSESADDPVFFYICGEGACGPGALNGAIRHYAKQFNAKLVALEHRYYGQSQPAEDLSTENLKYLSTDMALKDLARFQQHLQDANNWTGEWVAFGGSYPGSLAAYYRLHYPERVIGALASSAPVLAKEDFIEYDQHVTAVVGPKCAENMRLAVSQIEEIIAENHPIQKHRLKSRFLAHEIEDDVDFLYFVADIGATAVQYGMHHTFCNNLENAPDPLSGYAVFSQLILARMGINAEEMTPQGAMDDSIEAHSESVGYRQWLYQSCKEYGYWQNAHPDAINSTRSAQINLEYSRGICKRLFDIDTPADVENMNGMFYMALLNPMISHIYFTNGKNDPWSNLSLTQENGNATNPNLNYMSIENAAHCDDLHTPSPNDSEALQAARGQMESLLKVWLGQSTEEA